MKTDLQLKKLVIEELEWDPILDPSEIDVNVKNGVVTVTGSVNTNLEKIATEKAVERISGVKGFIEKINIKLS